MTLSRYGRVQSPDPPVWSTTLNPWVKTIDSRGGPGGLHSSAATVAPVPRIDIGRRSSFTATDNTRRFGIAAPSGNTSFLKTENVFDGGFYSGTERPPS